MRDTTVHAQCGCTGKLTHNLRRSFFKPTVVLECSAQGKGCNIGRRKTINLTRATTLNHRNETYQCSAVAARLTGSLFQSGLSMKQFQRALRLSGLQVSKSKIEAVIDTYAEAIRMEYDEQQNCINNAYKSARNTNVGIDTSFSQNRNAQYSQTAALEEKSSEIVQMVIKDKCVEKCSSNKLEALGTSLLLDNSLAAEMSFAAVSTDECSEVRPLLQRKAKIQADKFGVEMKIQNDAFHRLKNNRKARKDKFENPKIQSQRVFTKLEELKLEGLKEIALQLEIEVEQNKKMKKSDWINILDPKIRSTNQTFHLVVGKESKRLSINLNAVKKEEILNQIKAICGKALRAHDVDEACVNTKEALVEAINRCFYLARDLVSKKLLKLLVHHGVSVTQLQEMKLKPKMSKKQEKDMTIQLKKHILEVEEFKWAHKNAAATAKEMNIDHKIDEGLFYQRCCGKKVVLYDTKDEQLREIKLLKRIETLVCVGAVKVAENLHVSKRATFKQSKWIELVDSRLNRRSAKKFPYMNSSLFTKTNPEGEVQGQTLLGKFNTHEYKCTNESYEDSTEKSGAQKLQDAILHFFKHYRSDKARKKYLFLQSSTFEDEFSQFEKDIQTCWSLKMCEQFYLSVRTNMVESFFATRLFYVPKNLKFKKRLIEQK